MGGCIKLAGCHLGREDVAKRLELRKLVSRGTIGLQLTDELFRRAFCPRPLAKRLEASLGCIRYFADDGTHPVQRNLKTRVRERFISALNRLSEVGVRARRADYQLALDLGAEGYQDLVGTFCPNDQVVQWLPERTLLHGDMSDDAARQAWRCRLTEQRCCVYRRNCILEAEALAASQFGRSPAWCCLRGAWRLLTVTALVCRHC
ncbi:hypothetical protein D3C87_1183360 [compost metagenome]